VPVVPADERRPDLFEAAELDFVEPRHMNQAQRVPDVGRMLQHQFDPVLFELPNQVANAVSPGL